jgi:hypothetical protein
VRFLVGLAAGTVLALGATGASAAPTSVTLTFDGVHAIDSNLPAAITHKGPFTATPPVCAAGTAQDVEDVVIAPLTVLRKHTCDDGSGTFTALLPAVGNEHGGSGEWKIVAGTGRYETLRGIGTYIGKRISGDPNDFLTIVYQTIWQGVIDFDAVDPTLTTTARSKKLRRPPRTYTIRTVIDGHEPSIKYSVDIRSGKSPLAFKAGAASSGNLVVKLTIRAPRRARTASVIVTVADLVGNETTTTLTLALK